MCGIVGIIGRPPEDPAIIQRMTELLDHRGPDARDVWRSADAHIGHTRLAILDLSDAGRQPMHLGALTLAYNGEVYNYHDLRTHLPGPFVSDTDSEVLLHAWHEWGPAMLDRLNGMFAFVIWDADNRTLFAARDRLGIKPLYYRPLESGLAFASEAAPLLEVGDAEIDRSAICDYLTYGYVPTPKTAWRGIFKLPAGHSLTWRDGQLQIDRYWRPRLERSIDDIDRAAVELDGLLTKIVPEHMLSDVPVGIFLSGGLDSATISSYLEGVSTFTLGQPEAHRDEAPAARRVAEHLGTDHHEDVARIPDLADALDTIVHIYDEPFGDSAGLSVWLLSRFMRQHVTVALSGEGGDEIFCGYRWYGTAMTRPGSSVHRLLATLAPPLSGMARSGERRGTNDPFHRYSAFLGIFTPRQKQALVGEALPGNYDHLWHFRDHWRPELPLYQRLQWADLHTYLPDNLLTKVDRASMDFSLEVRPPLLDHRLVEWALKLDGSLQRDPATDHGKLVLRRLVEPRLPPGHLDLPKSGFNLGIRRLVERQPQVFDDALRRLDANGIIRRPRIMARRNEQMWALMVLDRWLMRHDRGYSETVERG